VFRHRTAVGRTQGTTRRAARRLLTALTATTAALGLLPLAAPTANAATYGITGRVTGLNASGTAVGVGDAGLLVYDANYDEAGSITFSSDGTYTATFSSPGPYRIQAGCWGDMTCASQWGYEWYSNKGSFEEATPVTAGATATVANIQLDRRSTVKGTVKNVLGQPITAAEVSVSKATGGQVITATPAADGSFTLTGVEAGPSNLTASDSSGQNLYENESWNGTASTPDYVDWSVPPGQTITGVNFVLDPWTGVIVSVTDEAGSPLENIGWNLYEYRPTEGDWWGRQYGPLLTDANGRFAEGTEVGKTYRVCAYDGWYSPDWNPALRYEDRCFDGATSVETATSFAPTTSERRQELTIKLPVAGKSLRAYDPFVTGSPTVGGTLTVDPGTWGPAGVTYGYRWLADGVAIPGATGQSYVPTSAVDGKAITAEVSGTLSGYKTASMRAWGNTVGAGTPTLASPLTITGSTTVGSTLTASHGAITPAPRYGADYRWLVDGVPVVNPNDDQKTFTLTSGHVGKKVTVRLLSYDESVPNELHASATSGVVVAGTLTAPTPTISGTTAVGSTLTALPGTWGPAPVTLAYQWYRSGVAIPGATASTYKLTTTDQAKTMTVTVTGSKSGYLTTAKTSSATSAVLGVFTTPTPTLSGTRKVAYTLTAVPGTWSPAPATWTYQWYRSGVAISGATARTYKLTSLDKGKYVKVRVTGARSGYLTKSVYSAQTAAIA
jgi:hypothetical protein